MKKWLLAAGLGLAMVTSAQAADKILEVLLGLRRVTALTQRDALPEKVISGLIVVVTPGVQR